MRFVLFVRQVVDGLWPRRATGAPIQQKDHMSRKASAWLIPLLASALTACTPLPSYRYKMTVEVETPEGLRTGSSVIEVRAHHEPSILPEQGGDITEVVGEAVAVDLPNKQTLFVLLAPSPQYTAWSLLPKGQLRTYANKARWLAEPGRTRVLPADKYPLLAHFEDISRPETVEQVYPDNLDRVFGPGTLIRRIVIESTNEPVTNAIKNRLPWLTMREEASRLHKLNSSVASTSFFKRPPGD